MTPALSDLPLHPVRSLAPALDVMAGLGYNRQTCLKGTGVQLSQLEDAQARMTLQQELTFYRNALELSADPTIGLKLGEPFVPQRYGLFGYALLSAATFRHALSLAEKFGRLTFSFFSFHFGVDGSQAWFSMTDPPPLQQDLLDIYLDRDISAASVDFSEILGSPLPLICVHFPHDGHGRKQVYREHFGCDIEFDSDPGRLVFSSAILDNPLPQSDPESSQHFQQQCQRLIAKLVSKGHFIDDVRMLVLSRPGFFPDIDHVAEKLGMSSRTLRRRLKEEGTSFRGLLDEIRLGLAREYLVNSRLPMEEISRLLGYTESGNFSHAFRRWTGRSPSEWRRRQGGL
jgi:AraC-like DNA-binding protein